MTRLVSGLKIAAATLAVLLLVLLVNIQAVAYDADWYQQEFALVKSYESLGTTLEETAKFSAHTSRFLMGSEEDPNVKMVINGEEQWLLNEREIAHMYDVQNLFHLAKRVMSYLAAGLLIYYFYARSQKETKGFWRILYKAAIGAFAVGLFTVLAISLDFTGAFNFFHKLVFTNDLWQLNPATDKLINLLPEQFFSDAVRSIIVRSASHLLLLLVASFAWSRDLQIKRVPKQKRK